MARGSGWTRVQVDVDDEALAEDIAQAIYSCIRVASVKPEPVVLVIGDIESPVTDK